LQWLFLFSKSSNFSKKWLKKQGKTGSWNTEHDVLDAGSVRMSHLTRTSPIFDYFTKPCCIAKLKQNLIHKR